MNIHYPRLRSLALPLLATGFTGAGFAAGVPADLKWDGPDVGGNGDGDSSYLSGTWSTSDANWDQGNGLPRLVWDNTNDVDNPADNAIFGGTYAADGTKTVTIGSNITVNQIQVLTGGIGKGAGDAGGTNRLDIGADPTQNDFAITFGGTYSDAFPAITGPSNSTVPPDDPEGFLYNLFNAKITGDLSAKGGLVIRHGSDFTGTLSNGSSSSHPAGRLVLANSNNDFVGDVVILGGSVLMDSSTRASHFGHPDNKIVLKGGALLNNRTSAGTTTFSRDIDVAAPSGIATLSAAAIGVILDLTGKITGSETLTRYIGGATNTLNLSGDMSGFTGTFENMGYNLNIQTTAMSQGDWIVRGGGVLKLNGSDDTHIANGADLELTGLNAAGTARSTLNMNGKSETINGLSGDGNVQNQTTGTISVLTLGDGDADASFAGVIRNNVSNSSTARIHLTKIGAGVQTLTGNSTYSGDTLVNAGTLEVTAPGKIISPATVAATLSGTGTVGAITTTSSGVVSPGQLDSIGTLTTAPNATFGTTGNVTMVAGSKFVAQIDSFLAPAISDRLVVGGNLDLGGATLQIEDLSTEDLPPLNRFVLATATGSITGTFAGIANNSEVTIGFNTYRLRYNDIDAGQNAITLTLLETGSDYADWATLAGVGAADEDDDNDGLDNGTEYVLGTNPKAGNGGGLSAAVAGGNVTFSFTRSDASETQDTITSVEVGTDLATWPSVFIVGADTDSSSAGVTVTENPADPGVDPGTDLITVTVPVGANPQQFGRLRVTVTP